MYDMVSDKGGKMDKQILNWTCLKKKEEEGQFNLKEWNSINL